MKAEWKQIPKDKNGFFDEESDLYERLPIIISEEYDGDIITHYIDEENWYDTISDLSKERYKYYIETMAHPKE